MQLLWAKMRWQAKCLVQSGEQVFRDSPFAALTRGSVQCVIPPDRKARDGQGLHLLWSVL